MNKLRRLFEFWIIPCANPDGVVIGNCVSNTQGFDMDKSFFDEDNKMKSDVAECFEVTQI